MKFFFAASTMLGLKHDHPYCGGESDAGPPTKLPRVTYKQHLGIEVRREQKALQDLRVKQSHIKTEMCHQQVGIN